MTNSSNAVEVYNTAKPTTHCLSPWRSLAKGQAGKALVPLQSLQMVRSSMTDKCQIRTR